MPILPSRTGLVAGLLSVSALDPDPRRLVNLERRLETGRIVGTVEISSALTARRPRFRVYSDVGAGSVPATRQASDVTGEMRNVVVYVETGPHAESSPSTPATSVMAQTNERFEPHVLPIVQGTRVEFPNRDDVYHNVFSLSSARTFDLGRYPKGSSKSVAFDKPGIAQVFCHIHSDMSAVVVVLPNPFFTSPDSSGRYVIDQVPPGDYTIVGWHERTKPAVQKVRVVAGQTTTIDFSLPLSPRVDR
jgi:plastocyanin